MGIPQQLSAQFSTQLNDQNRLVKSTRVLRPKTIPVSDVKPAERKEWNRLLARTQATEYIISESSKTDIEREIGRAIDAINRQNWKERESLLLFVLLLLVQSATVVVPQIFA